MSTSGDNGSLSNRSLWTGVARIVLLEVNLRARQVTLGPNISNAMGAKSTMLAAVSNSTSNGSAAPILNAGISWPSPLTRWPASHW
uniref:Uncharacterized protein n=1 Tax=Romanomermis culicivorax TaxID=13658 RepID=A0A915JKT9_ROMCU